MQLLLIVKASFLLFIRIHNPYVQFCLPYWCTMHLDLMVCIRFSVWYTNTLNNLFYVRLLSLVGSFITSGCCKCCQIRFWSWHHCLNWLTDHCLCDVTLWIHYASLTQQQYVNQFQQWHQLPKWNSDKAHNWQKLAQAK